MSTRKIKYRENKIADLKDKLGNTKNAAKRRELYDKINKTRKELKSLQKAERKVAKPARTAPPPKVTGPVSWFQKLTKDALRSLGLSEKSERYRSESGEIISKRQYQRVQRQGKTYSEFKKEKGEPRKKGATAATGKTKLKGSITRTTYADVSYSDMGKIIKRNSDKRIQLIVKVPNYIIQAGEYKGKEDGSVVTVKSGESHRTFLPLTAGDLAFRRYESRLADMFEPMEDDDDFRVEDLRYMVIVYTWPKKN